MFMCKFHVLVFVACCFKCAFAIKPEIELLRFFKNSSYDASFPPNKLPVQVSVQVGLYVLSEVDTRTQSFQLKFTTRLLWQDDRIAFFNGVYQIHHHTQLFWFPGAIIVNGIGGSNRLDNFLTGDGFVEFRSNGTIYYSEIKRMLLSCPMDLHDFPFDTQLCSLEISSPYSNGIHIVQVALNENPFTYETKSGKQVPITGWELLKTKTYQRPWSQTFINDTVFVWEFELKRLFTRHIVTYFLPTTVLVFLSFASFWIPEDAVPARTALVLTNFLSICVIQRGAASELPIVDYITPLEMYLIASITFILVVMVEYVLVIKKLSFNICSFRGTYQVESAEMQVVRNPRLTSSGLGQVSDEQTPIPLRVIENQKGQASVNIFDRYSRILMPSSYILFIVFYFLYHLKYL